MATKANLVMDKGSDFSVSLIVTGSDGTAFNLTGYTGQSKIRKHWSSNVYHTMTCDTSADPTGFSPTADGTVTSPPWAAGVSSVMGVDEGVEIEGDSPAN